MFYYIVINIFLLITISLYVHAENTEKMYIALVQILIFEIV